MNSPVIPSRRLTHFSPLRYPGGKGKLAAYVKAIIKTNGLEDGAYIEPYAGGAAIAMELLLQEYVSQVHINDISRPVHAFWSSVLTETDALCKRIQQTAVDIHTWDRQKRILMNPKDYDDLDLGFATFYLNRTNRSGILNGGIIGGRDQQGPWKIDARFNAPELISRIVAIARMGTRIKLYKQDAVKFLTSGVKRWAENSLIYLDPPYYVKGRDLYYDFYSHADHAAVASFVQSRIDRQHWIVSYDCAEPIRELYSGCEHIVYNVGYSARDRS